MMAGMKFWFTKGVWASARARKAVAQLSRETVSNIAVIRHAALGDMVLTRAFLTEARKAFPNAHITLSIVSNYTRGVPVDLVDRIHVVHGHDQRNTAAWKRLRRFRELGEQDIIFDLAASNRSVMTCMLNRAKLKIGFPYRKVQARLFYDVATCRSDMNFEVQDMLGMLHIFGIKTAYPHKYNMPGEPLNRARPYIVYFAGASTRDKCWPGSHFTQLIRNMAVRYPQHDHLVLEGIQDWESAEPILQPLQALQNAAAVNADSIEETTSLVKGAALVVSNDTGIRHVAIACETPTVGIFHHDPFRYWPRYDIHDIVIPEPEWPPSADDVMAACLDILDDSPAVT
jgi:ADP-heptose:LPS heptosyltransferase